MTLSAAPPLHPVGLADLDAARADWARTARRGARIHVVTLLVPQALLASSAFLTRDAYGQSLWLYPGLPLLILLAGFAIGLGLDRFRENRVGGPAAKGPSSVTTARSDAPGSVIWSSVMRTLNHEGFTGQWLTDAHTLVASKTSAWAATDLVAVRVLPGDGGGALVIVWSRPKVFWWAGAYPNYGRARRHANAVLRAIPCVHEVVREPQDPSKTGSIR